MLVYNIICKAYQKYIYLEENSGFSHIFLLKSSSLNLFLSISFIDILPIISYSSYKYIYYQPNIIGPIILANATDAMVTVTNPPIIIFGNK